MADMEEPIDEKYEWEPIKKSGEVTTLYTV